MILAILGVAALGGGGYYLYKKVYTSVIPKVTADVAKVEAVVSEVKSEVVTAVNAVENVTKSL